MFPTLPFCAVSRRPIETITQAALGSGETLFGSGQRGYLAPGLLVLGQLVVAGHLESQITVRATAGGLSGGPLTGASGRSLSFRSFFSPHVPEEQ